jgi:hypothetical protein
MIIAIVYQVIQMNLQKQNINNISIVMINHNRILLHHKI